MNQTAQSTTADREIVLNRLLDAPSELVFALEKVIARKRGSVVSGAAMRRQV